MFITSVIWAGSRLDAFTVSSKYRVSISEVRLRSNRSNDGLATSIIKLVAINESFLGITSIPFLLISSMELDSKLR